MLQLLRWAGLNYDIQKVALLLICSFQGYGVQTMAPQVAGDKSLGQRCNVHSAMVLQALKDTGLVISCVI